VLEIDNEYIMSPKDLCSIGFLDELIGTGVRVLKIEGRGKGPDYVHTVTRCYREAIDHYYAGSYSPEKAADWMKQMETVFNRGFWDGYYTGQKLGEWTNAHGSKASTRKLYIGRGNHYYPKKGIAEFCIEAYPLEVGDRVMITGKHIGYLEITITSLHINNSGPGNKAEQGDTCSFPLNVPVHKSDKLYKIMDNLTLEKA
jgi:putative protease